MCWSAVLAVLVGGVAWQQPVAERLRCEWRPSGEVVTDPCPEFYWECAEQAGYELAVASSREGLERPDLWDSGKVETRLTLAEYDGEPLESGREYHWRVRPYGRDGKPGRWSAPASFRAEFTPRPGRLAHIRTFLNFGGNPEVIASRYDATFRKEAKQHNPDILTGNYGLLATMVIPSQKHDDLTAFCRREKLSDADPPEEMWLHFQEDHKVRLHVGAERAENPIEERLCPGWDPANDRDGDGRVNDAEFADLANPRAHARVMKEARVPIYYWGPPRDDFVMNVGHPDYQRFLAEDYIQKQVEGYDGVFIDTTTPRVPGPGGGGKVLEHPEAGDWLIAMQTMLAKVKLALGDRLLLANGWQARPFVIDGMERENWLNIGHSLGRVEAGLAGVADLDRRGKTQFVQYNPIFDPEHGEFGVKVDVSAERDRVYGLALYYLAHGKHTYFGIGQHPYRRSEGKWFAAIEYDIGSPEGPYFVFDEGGVDAAEGDNLLPNGDFETDEEGDGNPDVWEIAEPVELDAEVKHGGRLAAKIASADPQINNFSRNYVTLKPRTTYTLMGWMKTEGLTGGQGAQIYPYEFEGAKSGGFIVARFGTHDWHLGSSVFTTGDDPTGRINFRVYGSTGTAWFDEIRLVEGAHVGHKVLARRFSKALVLVKPTPGALFGDDTATTHRLEGPHRPLRMDGSLGEPVGEVHLRFGEAAVLVRE